MIGYEYEGKNIEEYDRELEDHGYDDLTAFVMVKNQKPHLIYRNYNGNEEWY